MKGRGGKREGVSECVSEREGTSADDIWLALDKQNRECVVSFEKTVRFARRSLFRVVNTSVDKSKRTSLDHVPREASCTTMVATVRRIRIFVRKGILYIHIRFVTVRIFFYYSDFIAIK